MFADKFTKNLREKNMSLYTIDDPYVLQGQLPSSLQSVQSAFAPISRDWVGKELGQSMLDAGDRNWRQIEWIGFGFEFLAKQYLKNHFMIHENIPVEHRDVFDAFNQFPWDLKTHVLRNARGNVTRATPLNDMAAIDRVFETYNNFGLVIVDGNATFGDEYEQWRMRSNGGVLSATQIRNAAEGRTSRKRKDTFSVEKVSLFVFSAEDMAALKADKIMSEFKQGRQADGTPRNLKYKFDATRVQPTLSFSL